MRKTLLNWLLGALLLVSMLAIGACKPPQNDNSSSSETGSSSMEDLGEKYEHISIAQAIELAQGAGQTATTETYVIVGVVKTVVNATYGEMVVEDESGELYIYGSMAEDGTYYDKMTDKPVKGDTIVLRGVLMTYNDEPQMGAKNTKALILDWYHPEVEIDPSEYEEVSIASAREAREESQVLVEGVVAAIAYANGRIPTGIILVDDTASIYVFDKDVASQVTVGNQVKIAATKTYWILDAEASNASLYGYRGACQLESARLVSNDKGNHEFDKTWIEEITVKELLNAPFSENITTLLYKTTALVEKKEGTGFVNYYFRDLDGATGSYTYTQCNGSDFAWLDAYDGKVCTVYLTALNAKSTPAECFYRLLPVEVTEVENFAFPEKDIPAFALEYGVSDLISGEAYGANPALQLPNGYSNSLIGAENVSISYEVSNAAVAELVEGADTTTLNLLQDGSCTVTATASYKTYTASITKTVTLRSTAQIATPTIAEVIAKADETKVQVRGIVMSSLVNKDGFYLGDATGMIAVLTDGETLGKIKPGDEVVFEGYKVHCHKNYDQDTLNKIAGQCAIVGSVNGSGENVSYTADSKMLANYFGNNSYDTSYFIENKTIDELYDLPIGADYTNNVYKVKAKIVLEGSQYYSNILLQDENGTKKLRLYCSGSSQYSWLKAYEGQVVEMELAVCNWNDKTYYTGCVISATLNGVKVFNTLNFSV